MFAPYLHRPIKISVQSSEFEVKFGLKLKISRQSANQMEILKFRYFGLVELAFGEHELKFAKKLNLRR